MNTVSIRVNIYNSLTHSLLTQSEVQVQNYSFEIMEANAHIMSEMMPDCLVSLYASNGDFTCLPAFNMVKDSKAYDRGELSWEQYCNKWNQGSLAGCNEE
jgi:hypothetical protein